MDDVNAVGMSVVDAPATPGLVGSFQLDAIERLAVVPCHLHDSAMRAVPYAYENADWWHVQAPVAGYAAPFEQRLLLWRRGEASYAALLRTPVGVRKYTALPHIPRR